MPWQEKILEYPQDEGVARRIVEALDRFLAEDAALLEANAHEQAITSRLGYHLQHAFPEWNVDCEYNRDRHEIKTLGGQIVVPDVIVHQRGEEKNLLVIEAKKSNSAGEDQADLEKLQSFKDELNYKHALFVKFTVPPDTVGIEDVQWV